MTDTVDKCLNEIDRIRAKHAGTQAALWAAEFLLHRVQKLLPHLIADSPHNAVHRDVLADEIRELLTEDREHPGAGIELPGEVDDVHGEGADFTSPGDGSVHVDI